MTKSMIIAEMISLITSPLLVLMPMPFFLVYEATSNLSLAILWMIISLAFILVFLIFILLGIKLGLVSNINISRREERPRVFLFAIMFTMIYLLVSYFYRAPVIIFVGVFGLISGIVILGIANTFTKVSWHLSMLSAFLMFLVLVEGPLFLSSFVLLPLVAWARIKTKNHTRKQTILGAGLGISTTVIIYVIFKYIGSYV
jgi:hypothetical protein